MRARFRLFVGLLKLCAGIVLVPGTAQAQPGAWIGQYGVVGLMQTPTARSLGSSTLGIGLSDFSPYRVYFMHAQPFDWLQGSFQFSRFRDEPLPPNNIAFTDKSGNVKVRLVRESTFLPEIAVGLIDVGGTGLLSSEYVVASRRIYDVDVHFGIGWGRLGSSDDIDNPLSVFSSNRRERPPPDVGQGGTFATETWFRGPSAFFGGVVWTPGGGPLSLFAEVEGNSYETEAFDREFDVDSRVNAGVNYRFRSFDLGLSYQRGNEIGVTLSTTGQFDEVKPPEKVLRPNQPSVPSRSTLARYDTADPVDPAKVVRIRRELRTQFISLRAIDTDEESGTITVWYSAALGDDLALHAGRIGRTLLRHTGQAYDEYILVDVNANAETARYRFPREQFHAMIDGDLPVDAFVEYVNTERSRAEGYRSATYRDMVRYPSFRYAFSPMIRSNTGSVTNFFLAQAMLTASATAQVTQGLSLTAGVALNIADNFGDRLDFDAPTDLPPVRSELQRYLREGSDFYVRQFEANYVFPVATDTYGRISGGIFEEMYGGVASEILHRPSGKRWAVGLDVAHVWKREFKQRFEFLDFNTTTGHLSFYYEPPVKDLRLVASVGRYLARDIGTTLDISRRFRSGVRFGIFATITNVSSETFGEGSFDKGFYVDIPMTLFTARDARGSTNFLFRPLTRDGGAKVANGRSLYGSTEISRTETLLRPSDNWLR